MTVYIASSARSPIGKFGGSMVGQKIVDVAAKATVEALLRANISPQEVDETIFGTAILAGLGPNPARQVALNAGLSPNSPAITVSAQCISGMKAVEMAWERITLGKAHVVVAGGMESLSNVPYLVHRARWGARIGDFSIHDAIYHDSLMDPSCHCHIGITVEEVAKTYGITREEVDSLAFASHSKALRNRTKLAEEILPLKIQDRKWLEIDESVRSDCDMATLAKLPGTLREGGLITAGNSPGLTDAAIAVVLVSEDILREREIMPLGRIMAAATTAVEPAKMALGPVAAIRKVLSLTDFSLNDIELFEINEAFGAQVCICLREMPLPLEKLNVNGGAIALGHPFGFTGARLITTLLYELRRRGGGRGIAATCSGGGPAMAGVVESH